MNRTSMLKGAAALSLMSLAFVGCAGGDKGTETQSPTPSASVSTTQEEASPSASMDSATPSATQSASGPATQSASSEPSAAKPSAAKPDASVSNADVKAFTADEIARAKKVDWAKNSAGQPILSSYWNVKSGSPNSEAMPRATNLTGSGRDQVTVQDVKDNFFGYNHTFNSPEAMVASFNKSIEFEPSHFSERNDDYRTAPCDNPVMKEIEDGMITDVACPDSLGLDRMWWFKDPADSKSGINATLEYIADSGTENYFAWGQNWIIEFDVRDLMISPKSGRTIGIPARTPLAEELRVGGPVSAKDIKTRGPLSPDYQVDENLKQAKK